MDKNKDFKYTYVFIYYIINTGVSATEKDLGIITHQLACELYKSTANTITVAQNDLDGLVAPNVIPKTNVTVSSTIFTNTGSLSYSTAFTTHNTWNLPQDLYVVSANQIGVTSANITVGLKVPGGTPADSYAGDLVIAVPNT